MAYAVTATISPSTKRVATPSVQGPVPHVLIVA
jgi:hypothetical protein